MDIATNQFALLHLLQLASPTLPIGAYSYSEGIETLCENGVISDRLTLQHWLEQELAYGAVRLEAAVIIRAYAGISEQNSLNYWNNWLSATRESSELRASSWQMGTSLIKLLMDILPPAGIEQQQMQAVLDNSYPQGVCNLAIAFGIAAAIWQIDCHSAVAAFLHSWATNLIGAGVKLIPLGQTTGQQILLFLNSRIMDTTKEVLTLQDDELESCNWGLALASMQHENLYSRLFRS